MLDYFSMQSREAQPQKWHRIVSVLALWAALFAVCFFVTGEYLKNDSLFLVIASFIVVYSGDFYKDERWYWAMLSVFLIPFWSQ